MLKGPLSKASVDAALDHLLRDSSDSEDDHGRTFLLSSDEEDYLDGEADTADDGDGGEDNQDISDSVGEQLAVANGEDSGNGTSEHAGSGDRSSPTVSANRGRSATRGRGRSQCARSTTRSVVSQQQSAQTARTRGRARQRGSATQSGGQARQGEKYFTWDKQDTHAVPQFPFQPSKPAGLDLPDNFVPQQEIDFFKLFFSDDVIETIVEHTNTYADMYILRKPYYGAPDGSWDPVTPAEIKKFIAFILYMGLVRVSNYEDYWRTFSLYNGLWGRAFFSRDRFKALLAFIHVDDPDSDTTDRLCKVRYVYEQVQKASCRYWQPRQHVSLDERMIRFKGRHAMKVYLKNKPVKWGFKSYALCDSSNHYNWKFEIYTGQQQAPSVHGLIYDLVMRLFSPLQGQGYCLYTDNYYTSQSLATTSSKIKAISPVLCELTESVSPQYSRTRRILSARANGVIYGMCEVTTSFIFSGWTKELSLFSLLNTEQQKGMTLQGQ